MKLHSIFGSGASKVKLSLCHSKQDIVPKMKLKLCLYIFVVGMIGGLAGSYLYYEHGSETARFFSQALDSCTKACSKMADEVSKAASKTAEGISNAALEMADEISSAASKTAEGISNVASETADGISKAASETRRQLAPIGYWLTGSNKMTIVIPDDYVQVYQRHQKAVERAAKEAAMNLLRLFKKK